MKIAIHPDHGNLVSDYCQKYVAILNSNKVSYEILNIDFQDFFQIVKNFNYFIYRWGHTPNEVQKAKSILPILEYDVKIKVFPNQKTCWSYDDKIKQYYLLTYHGFPFIKTNIFWSHNSALEFADIATYPLILKLKNGAGSSNVKLIRNKTDARRHISLLFKKGVLSEEFFSYPKFSLKQLFNSQLRKLDIIQAPYFDYWEINKGYVYFQEFLSNNNFDIRITTIGKRAFGFIRNNRKGDFRASGSGNISYNLDMINMECVKLAMDISAFFEFQSMSYDFLYDKEGKIQIGEISYTFQDTAVFNCLGFWDSELNWHEGHFWPQYFQLVDLLERPELIQPKL